DVGPVVPDVDARLAVDVRNQSSRELLAIGLGVADEDARPRGLLRAELTQQSSSGYPGNIGAEHPAAQIHIREVVLAADRREHLDRTARQLAGPSAVEHDRQEHLCRRRCPTLARAGDDLATLGAHVRRAVEHRDDEANARGLQSRTVLESVEQALEIAPEL